jgi:hypothetical protein
MARAKLEGMLRDIDDNLEELQKERDLYQKSVGSAMSVSQARSGWQSHAPSVVSKFQSEPNLYSV